jgi:hypothetical protein
MRGIVSLSLPVLLVVVLSASCSSSPDREARSIEVGHGTLLNALLDSLQARNARITMVQVLAAQAVPWSTARVALLARGTREGDFNGRFDDELFGVFIVDSTLTHVSRVVDTIPTPRWHDYDVAFQLVGPDSLYVVGAGSSYGDQSIRRAYDWQSLAADER